MDNPIESAENTSCDLNSAVTASKSLDDATGDKKKQNDCTEDVFPAPAPVFKIPTFIKKNVSKAEKCAHEEKSINSNKDVLQTDSGSTTKTTADLANDKILAKDLRPLISFQPKSLTLPSQVYKPHRPSATEYIEHFHKKDKEKKQQILEKAAIIVSSDNKSTTTSKSAKQESSGSKSKSTKLNYNAPGWSCLCEETSDCVYSLEVLKTGSIIDTISLVNKEYFVFGRLSDCDVVLEHPSISRHHAVLQYGKPSEKDDVEFQKDGSGGFYLYDLGSTHSTYLNKSAVPSHKYYRVKVGHMMKFGGSSRLYILQGPQLDEEEEAKESATELREKARAARNKKDLAKMMMGDDSDEELDDEKIVSKKRQDDEDTGITWGMLEDAVAESDEESEDEAPEPTVSLGEKKEPFYVKDPSKALKNFYEKEGLEIDFECTERRPGQWNARLELPIDTPSGKAVVAEVSITGKKKEAINNCAVEACRLLDKYGMFKQSEHHHRKVKEWEKEDFYDSDEDQYWDRTGDLDKKRQQRKLRIGVKSKKNEDRPETYESLKKQIDDLEKEISDIEEQLEKDKKAVQTKEGSKDPLEEFMMQVKSGKTLDSITRSKLKIRLLEARKESSRLVKLAEIARPSSLPSLSSQSSKSMSFIGRMKGKKKGLLIPNKPLPLPVCKPTSSNDEIEEEEDDEPVPLQQEKSFEEEKSLTTSLISSKLENTPVETTSNLEKTFFTAETSQQPLQNISSRVPDPSSVNGSAPDEKREIIEKEMEKSIENEKEDTVEEKPATVDDQNTSNRKRMFGPTLPQDLKDRLMGMEPSADNVNNDSSTKSKRRKQRKTSDKSNFDANRTLSNDPDYADWIPPDDQSGDGTTSLNAKFGY